MTRPRCQVCGVDTEHSNKGKISACPGCGVSLWYKDQTKIRARKRFELVVALAGGDFACSIEMGLTPPGGLVGQADNILTELYGEAPDA